jgi:hypothetical protein
VAVSADGEEEGADSMGRQPLWLCWLTVKGEGRGGLANPMTTKKRGIPEGILSRDEIF